MAIRWRSPLVPHIHHTQRPSTMIGESPNPFNMPQPPVHPPISARMSLFCCICECLGEVGDAAQMAVSDRVASTWGVAREVGRGEGDASMSDAIDSRAAPLCQSPADGSDRFPNTSVCHWVYVLRERSWTATRGVEAWALPTRF
jgi:hypothetical protein